MSNNDPEKEDQGKRNKGIGKTSSEHKVSLKQTLKDDLFLLHVANILVSPSGSKGILGYVNDIKLKHE
jgi:hypothetical protein